MLFYTIAGQKVALNGLYTTDNNMGGPMCPPILLSGLVMLSRGVGNELNKIFSGIYISTTIHFVEHFLVESLLFLFFVLFHNCIVLNLNCFSANLSPSEITRSFNHRGLTTAICIFELLFRELVDIFFCHS